VTSGRHKRLPLDESRPLWERIALMNWWIHGQGTDARVEADSRSEYWWNLYPELDERRLFTAVNDRRLRADFCRLYQKVYLGDSDNGCPADRPPPATIVTENGDVPLIGPWPD
jgi:hypothetical protein